MPQECPPTNTVGHFSCDCVCLPAPRKQVVLLLLDLPPQELSCRLLGVISLTPSAKTPENRLLTWNGGSRPDSSDKNLGGGQPSPRVCDSGASDSWQGPGIDISRNLWGVGVRCVVAGPQVAPWSWRRCRPLTWAVSGSLFWGPWSPEKGPRMVLPQRYRALLS